MDKPDVSHTAGKHGIRFIPRRGFPTFHPRCTSWVRCVGPGRSAGPDEGRDLGLFQAVPARESGAVEQRGEALRARAWRSGVPRPRKGSWCGGARGGSRTSILLGSRTSRCVGGMGRAPLDQRPPRLSRTPRRPTHHTCRVTSSVGMCDVNSPVCGVPRCCARVPPRAADALPVPHHRDTSRRPAEEPQRCVLPTQRPWSAPLQR